MNPRSNKSPKLRERLREVVQAEILAAAEEEFAREGLHRARMETIASRAGVAVGTLYNHFEDREALLRHLLDARRAELLAQVDEALEDSRGRPFRDRLGAFYGALMEHFEEHRRFLSIVIQAEHARKITAVGSPSTTMKEMYRRAERLVEEGCAEGVLRPDDADIYPALLVGLVRSALLQDLLYASKPRSAPQRSEALVTFFLSGASR